VKSIDVRSEFGAGISYQQAWPKVAEHLRLKEQKCWLARVEEILTLVQGTQDWKVKYRINTSTVTRFINPQAVHELLEADMIGKPLINVRFIHSPTRIEEVVILE
jgi:hypothetical protein